jgi:hypothetical protein
VPYKKLSESRSQYTSLNAHVRGNIHQINKQTQTRDPREFVKDEAMVLYRWVWPAGHCLPHSPPSQPHPTHQFASLTTMRDAEKHCLYQNRASLFFCSQAWSMHFNCVLAFGFVCLVCWSSVSIGLWGLQSVDPQEAQLQCRVHLCGRGSDDHLPRLFFLQRFCHRAVQWMPEGKLHSAKIIIWQLFLLVCVLHGMHSGDTEEKRGETEVGGDTSLELL